MTEKEKGSLEPPSPARDWYFFTYRTTLVEVRRREKTPNVSWTSHFTALLRTTPGF